MSTAILSSQAAKPVRLASLLGVLGVVYGDIGTSPLYAFKASLAEFTATGTHALEIMGVLSLMFYALILTVTIKYVLLILRADNNGEGGILALMALAQRGTKGARVRHWLGLVGIAGACLFFGDGIITPAISVLSAVEGLQVVYPQFHAVVVPISVVVICILFAVQSRGTGADRQGVRAGDVRVVRDAGRVRPVSDRPVSGRATGGVAALCRPVRDGA